MSILMLAPIGMVLGLAYIWTRNVFFCGILHGTLFNQQPLFWGRPTPGAVDLLLPAMVLYALSILVYRCAIKKTPPEAGSGR